MTSSDSHLMNDIGERISMRMKESRTYFDAQKTRWDGHEDDLMNELSSVCRRLDEWEEFHAGMQQRQIQLRKEKQGLEEKRVELDSRSCELDEQQLEIDTKRRQLERELEERQAEMANGAVNEELESQIRDLQRELESLREKAAAAGGDRADLDQQIAAANEQREKVETGYKAARQALLASRDAGKDLHAKLAHSQKLLEKRAEQITEMESQQKTVESQFRKKEAELQQKLAEAEEAASRAAEATDSYVDEVAYEEMQKERDQLINQVFLLNRQLESAGGDGGGGAEVEELQSKLQMAAESLQALRDQNQQLQAQLASGEAEAEGGGVSGSEWEAYRSVVEEQLHSMPPLDQLTVDKAMRVTEMAVTKKDQEIAELKKILAESSEASGGGVASNVEVRAEMEKLQKLQEEMQQKLKQAEIEISFKRAETARASAELEERLRDSERSGRSLRDQMGM